MKGRKQQGRGVGRWATGFAVMLVVGLVGSAAFGLFAQASSRPQPASGDNAVAAAKGPSLDSAISALTATCHDTWPNEFGWVWRKPTGPQEPSNPEDGIFVGFSEGAEEKVAELAQDFPRPELLVPVTVKYSSNELVEFQDRIRVDGAAAERGLPPLGHVSDGYFDLDLDVKTGDVLVMMPKITGEVKRAFRNEYGPDGIGIRFIEQELGRPAACINRKRCGKQLRAGIQARRVPNFNHKKCTIGFTVKVNDITHVLSAAHCSNGMNEPRYHGDPDNAPEHPEPGGTFNPPTVHFGKVKKRKWAGGVDAESIEVNLGADPLAPPFVANPWVYRDFNNQKHPVKSFRPWGDLAEGDMLCKAGTTSRLTCGEVLSKFYNPVNKPRRKLKKFIATDACAAGGDSGGPVFRGSKALGITTGIIHKEKQPGCYHRGRFHPNAMYFGAINWALTNLNATLVYTP